MPPCPRVESPQYTDKMRRTQRSLPILGAAFLLLTLVGVATWTHTPAHAQNAATNPWTTAQITQPSELAAMLSHPQGTKPVILQVGFRVLYRSKHIPGALYAGPASTPAGRQLLQRVARTLPRNADIYLYCGCCPIEKCPNLRPAFWTLQSMGFTHLHVVILPTSFGKDWVAHGYPVAGESAPGQ